MSLRSVFVSIAYSVDPSLGRVEISSLAPQTLMELLVEGFVHPEKIRGSAEAPKPIIEWDGVRTREIDAVIDVFWHDCGLEGSLNLQFLPRTIETFQVGTNSLNGTVDVTDLPPSIQLLDLKRNNFGGTVDLTRLPASLEYLWLQSNSFSGCIDLTHLPDGMYDINLRNNEFDGETDFSKLPESLQFLDVRGNYDLSGEIRARSRKYVDADNTKVKVIAMEESDRGE